MGKLRMGRREEEGKGKMTDKRKERREGEREERKRSRRQKGRIERKTERRGREREGGRAGQYVHGKHDCSCMAL